MQNNPLAVKCLYNVGHISDRLNNEPGSICLIELVFKSPVDNDTFDGHDPPYKNPIFYIKLHQNSTVLIPGNPYIDPHRRDRKHLLILKICYDEILHHCSVF